MANSDAVFALMLVGSSAFLEARLSGPKPFRFLRQLQQPRWALPNWGWVGVGALFYATMTTTLFLSDPIAGLLAAAYLVFLTYDFAWMRALMKLNPEYAGPYPAVRPRGR